MRPQTICHPEALADWRANDEAAPVYDWQGLNTFSGETKHVNNNTLPEKQKETRRVLARPIKEAIEREIGRCRTLRQKGEA